MEKFCLSLFRRRYIGREKMVCKNWGVYIKTPGDYDRCLVVYHKFSHDQGVVLTYMVNLVFNDSVYCKAKGPQSVLRYSYTTFIVYDGALSLLAHFISAHLCLAIGMTTSCSLSTLTRPTCTFV